MRLRPLDFVAILVSAAAVGLASMAAYSGDSGEPEAVVQGVGGEWIYPLDADREIEVEGPLGVTLIHIGDGVVRFEDSPCPTKSCVAQGGISESGQWLACLPNQVFVRIEGAEGDGGVDAAAY